MIREFHLADLFTLANAACGMGAVLFSMSYMGSQSVDYFFRAAVLAPAALVFDALDGRRARWRRKHSALGASWIRSRTLFVWGRARGTRIRCSMHGGWDWIALLDFVCCGVGRLTGPARRKPGLGRLDHRALGSASVGPAVCPIRNLDDQQNRARSKILGATLYTPPFVLVYHSLKASWNSPLT
jgi:hypothetical protein